MPWPKKLEKSVLYVGEKEKFFLPFTWKSRGTAANYDEDTTVKRVAVEATAGGVRERTRQRNS